MSNFYFYFCGNHADGRPSSMNQIFEQDPHYQRLKAEHPDLVERLTSVIHERAIVKRMDTCEALAPVREDLRIAFDLMVSYGATPKELMM